jgi:hypothetical protein
MIEKFADGCGMAKSECLDLNHTSNAKVSGVPLIPKFIREPGIEGKRTSESGR